MPTGTDNSHRRLVLGGRPRLEAALAGWIAAVKGHDPLREVVVVTGSNLACGHLSRSVARHLGAHAGVRFVSIHALAPELAADRLAHAGLSTDPVSLRLLSPLLRERLVAALVARRAGETDWYFEAVARTPGLPRALARTIDDLREAGVPSDALAVVGSRKAADLAALYKEYVATLRRRGLVDDTGLYALATEAASQGAPPTVAGVPVALFGIYDLPAMQAALVAALAADRPFAAFLPSSSGVCRYAAPALAFLESLGLQVDGDRDARSAPDGCASAGIGVPAGIGAPTAFANGADVSQTQVNIVSVADDVAERRAAVAEVLRAAADVAFHDIAVIVADRSGRDRLARALQAHDIPVAARGADDGVSARACRLLLDCLLPVAGRPLRRDAVIDLAATAPRLDAVADAAAGAATVALWDTSRGAPASWPTTNGTTAFAVSNTRSPNVGHARQKLPSPSKRARPCLTPPPRPRHRRPTRSAAAASLREFVGRLAGRRRRLLASRTWPEATHHLIDAARTLCGVPPDDPALSALAELADVALVDDAGPRESFGG